MRALRWAPAGRSLSHFSQNLSGNGSRRVGTDAEWPDMATATVALTRRERELVDAMLEGIYSTEALAKRLGVTRHTVHWHFATLFERTGTRSRMQLLAYAVRIGWVRSE